MRHLYASQVEVLRLASSIQFGTPTLSWVKLDEIVDPALGVAGELRCRLDLGFIRAGKDQPAAVVAGRAPDRTGVLFCDYTPQLRAGDRVRTVVGPVEGTFEVRAIPDTALDMTSVHHVEVQIFEVAQQVSQFPSAIPHP